MRTTGSERRVPINGGQTAERRESRAGSPMPGSWNKGPSASIACQTGCRDMLTQAIVLARREPGSYKMTTAQG